MTYREPTPGARVAQKLVPAVLLALTAAVNAVLVAPAAASTTGLSDGIVQRAPVNEASAVFGYDPATGKWTELSNVTWTSVASAGHSGYLIQAAAPNATAISTFKVVIAGSGTGATSVEVYMTPTRIIRLTAGETTLLRINLF